ncbi:MAG: hypothetical protein ABI592_12720 [Acidobacteriota bacterium]
MKLGSGCRRSRCGRVPRAIARARLSRRPAARLFLALAALILSARASVARAEADSYPTGKIVEKIVCRSDPRFSFALYLPARFDPAKRWPLLFLFDPRGRGAAAAERFREGAERFGWVIVSSNETRSDDPTAPNREAIRALWAEAPARFPVDPRRIYAGGFSGGARLAFSLAFSGRGILAGVIAASGGLPTTPAASHDVNFPAFLTAGWTDFNYQEMKALDRTLEKRGSPHRLRTFDGGHDWAPAAIGTESIGWLEILAMKAGLRPRDEALAAALLNEDLARAEAREKSGDIQAAFEIHARALIDFDGLAPVDASRDAAARLRDAARKGNDDEARRDARESAEIQRLQGALAAILDSAEPVPLPSAAHRLDVASLRERAASKDPAERLSAKRTISSLFVQTYFYRPRDFFAAQEPRRAAQSLEIAAAFEPERGAVWYDLGCARARAGDGRRAVEALRTAFERGFTDAAHMAEDPDLVSIRGRADYKALAAEMAAPR